MREFEIPDEAWTAVDRADLWIPRSDLRAALAAAAPLILAAELDRWADAWSVLRDEWRDIDGRTVRSSALGHAVQELNARVAELRTSAAVTPEPAGRRVWSDPGSREPTDCSVTGHRGTRWLRSTTDGGWHRGGVSVNAGTEWHYWPALVDREGPVTEVVPAVPPAEPGAGV